MQAPKLGSSPLGEVCSHPPGGGHPAPHMDGLVDAFHSSRNLIVLAEDCQVGGWGCVVGAAGKWDLEVVTELALQTGRETLADN